MLINEEETRLSLQLDWWGELLCKYWSVCIGLPYANTEIFSLLSLSTVSTNASSLLISIVNFMFW